MTGRLAVGSVSTLAMGALLLGSASFLLNRPGSASHAAPWGNIASLSNSAAEVRADDKAQLLKMASLTNGTASTAQAATSPAPPAIAATADAAPATPVSPPAATPVVADPAGSAPQAAAPVQLASAEDAAPPVTAPSDADVAPASKSGLLDLNTASAEQLDHAGAGHIGRTIVAHRPYRSVKDLVSKRVLRTSDYQKIATRVGVD